MWQQQGKLCGKQGFGRVLCCQYNRTANYSLYPWNPQKYNIKHGPQFLNLQTPITIVSGISYIDVFFVAFTPKPFKDVNSKAHPNDFAKWSINLPPSLLRIWYLLNIKTQSALLKCWVTFIKEQKTMTISNPLPQRQIMVSERNIKIKNWIGSLSVRIESLKYFECFYYLATKNK